MKDNGIYNLKKNFFVKIIPAKYKMEYDVNVIAHNYGNLKVFSFFSFIFSSVFILQYLLSFVFASLKFPDIRYVFVFIFLFIVSSVYLLLYYPLRIVMQYVKDGTKKFLVYLFVFLLYIWGIALTLLDVIYTQDISLYVIVLCSIAILLRIQALVATLFLFMSTAAFLVIVSFMQLPEFSIVSYFTTSAVFTALALVITIVLNNNYLDNYYSKKIIEVQYSKLEKLTNQDSLTGLYNRRYLFAELKREIYRAQRYNNSLSLMFVDIDHFKRINDTLGHRVGDRVIEEVAGSLKSVLRESDIIARYGGEEFVVVSTNTDRMGAITLANRLRVIVEESMSNKLPDLPNPVTVSIGVDEVSQYNLEEAIQKVDKLLYKAKANGRNRVEYE